MLIPPKLIALTRKRQLVPLALLEVSLELVLKSLVLLLFLDALLNEFEELVFLRLQFGLLVTHFVDGVCQLLLKGF